MRHCQLGSEIWRSATCFGRRNMFGRWHDPGCRVSPLSQEAARGRNCQVYNTSYTENGTAMARRVRTVDFHGVLNCAGLTDRSWGSEQRCSSRKRKILKHRISHEELGNIVSINILQYCLSPVIRKSVSILKWAKSSTPK